MPVFDIVKMETRVTRMLGWFSGAQNKITDLLPGGKTRTKFEAVAVEMEQQDYQTYRAIQKAIPISIYRAFNFLPIPAARAHGQVTFSANAVPAQGITIPSGTRVATTETSTSAEKVYETTQAATLPAGESTVSVPISSTTTGVAGNTGTGTINVIKTSIAGIDAVTNAAAITSGSERETETDRAIRFQKYIATIARGTSASLEYAAMQAALHDNNGEVVEAVKQAVAVDAPTTTAGFAEVFIYNGTGSTSQALIDEAKRVIDGYILPDGTKVAGYKAAGVVVSVAAAEDMPQDVTAEIKLSPGAIADEAAAKATTAVTAYLSAMRIGTPLVKHELVERIMAVPGVFDVTITDPGVNVLAQSIGAPVFTGAGLNDLIVAGPFTAGGKRTYVVEVDGTGGPNTFKWSRDNGASWMATGVQMVAGFFLPLEDGIRVEFQASTGHTLGNQWTFVVSTAYVIVPNTITITAA
jgi:uncharacterized phage protein gp47/JayE